ncbi:ABC transporter ATP-binding protein [Cryobacterium sp. TMT1-21]|uniref:ABC transporter ATP-binding protein n=1 Tax=Cryobacterium shii TaxID=1259235 RepID=A0AAQ2HHE5_9MICO|nr:MULTISPECIES: ABC transporter ATP-binding protein [Cryobacterium]TFC53132.1 ABC transporter ATP-binding protein [Cryobacterium shii]TFC87685.1 ABC transporter ATP-binding protein [Cryobacterium sp. TmT2-59]TFD10095.1 ABC transporter ATP-binding protein [Cryobacterium sp. TMT1-21]TFD20695.1 ABC transporter ATP-binding protein [Cryobacterium sp. TMT2-23]TFD22038.1 ABC transporter ATP-binding protein [Cryobacterium sp. TMT4-10]
MTADQPAIRLTGLTKSFGAVNAVDGVDLDIAEGEFFSMLGPSGSGKTTVLRLIAGFEQPTSGTVSLLGQDVTNRAPFDRDVNTVFQDYALFPHMSVLDNVAYGLRVRGVSKRERHAQAQQALETVRLGGFGNRKPGQLSGGQRQRVALARATVVRPKVLLLDEPLGALDLKLREQMQVELKELQRELGITFIFVTHDQEEALTLSDRIAVFNEGRIEQLGTPAEIYDRPVSPFVAAFVGTSNIFTDALSRVLLGRGGIHTLRPEKISIGRTDAALATERTAAGTLAEVIYVGSSTRLIVDLDAGIRIVVLEQNDAHRVSEDERGSRVSIGWGDRDVVALEKSTAVAAEAGSAPADGQPGVPGTGHINGQVIGQSATEPTEPATETAR